MLKLIFFLQLAEKYRNIFSLRRGCTKIVYVSGYKMVKESFVIQGESVARCVPSLFDEIYKGRGKSEQVNMCGYKIFT